MDDNKTQSTNRNYKQPFSNPKELAAEHNVESLKVIHAASALFTEQDPKHPLIVPPNTAEEKITDTVQPKPHRLSKKAGNYKSQF